MTPAYNATDRSAKGALADQMPTEGLSLARAEPEGGGERSQAEVYRAEAL